MFFAQYLRNYRLLACKITYNFLKSYYCYFSTFQFNMSSKSPNILIYTGNNCSKLFKNIEKNILHCLGTPNYLIYHLMSSEVMSQSWTENLCLLVIASDELDHSTAAVFEKYIMNSGNVLLTCSKFDKLAETKCRKLDELNINNLIQVNYCDITEIAVSRGKYTYYSPASTVLCEDTCNKPVIHKTKFNDGVFITSEIYFDRDFDTNFTKPDLPKHDGEKCLSILKYILTQEFALESEKDDCMTSYCLSHGIYTSDKDSEDKIPIGDYNEYSNDSIFHNCFVTFQGASIKLPIHNLNQTNAKSFSFDFDLYFSNLHTEIYGHQLVYFPVISSTMDIADQLSDYNGMVIVAGCQISGKGRYTNKWISPEGCAMFTLHFTLPLSSNLGQKLSLIQHMAALAVVHGIRSKKEYKDINLKIKWPNDVYFEGLKFGGLIVTSKIQDRSAHMYVGWGINVENSQPTICINDAIKKYNRENFCHLPCLRIEHVVASILSQMEYFIQDFQNSGSDNFFQYYYSYWLHGNQKVKLENLNEEVIIQGLDEYGFLIVETVKEGKKLYLQPDGNRFDIMKNLIYSRKTT